MTPPRPAHTHTWDGGTVPTWLDPHQYWFDNNQLVVATPDGPAQPRPGWTLVGWSSGHVTIASPWTAAHVYAPDGIAGRLARAAALYEQWVKAGPPPLGAPLARWWDQRLAELHNALHPPTEQSERTTPNNPTTSKD